MSVYWPWFHSLELDKINFLSSDSLSNIGQCRNLHTCSLLISLPSFHFPNKLRSDLLPLSFPHPCLTISQPEYGTLALRLCVGVHVRAQSSLTLCGPMDCSLPGSSVHGFLQARILEWVAISFSKASSQPKDQSQVLPHCTQILYHLNHQVCQLIY